MCNERVEGCALAWADERGDDRAGVAGPCDDRVGDHTGQDRGRYEEPDQQMTRSPLQSESDLLTVCFVSFAGRARRDSFRNEVVLGCGETQLCRGRPAAVIVKPRAVEKVARVPAGGFPLVHSHEERRLLGQVVAVLIDPIPQPVPFGQQGFVGDFDRRAAGRRVTISARSRYARTCRSHCAGR